MKHAPLHHLTGCWDDMTYTILDLKELPLEKMYLLLKETFKVLACYCKEELIPKEICKIILSMEDFLKFASMMEEKEKEKGYYHALEFCVIIHALRDGFFAENLAADYPKLKTDVMSDKPLVMNFEKDSLEDYFNLVNPNQMP